MASAANETIDIGAYLNAQDAKDQLRFITCGSINVPLNHDDPTGTRIDLTFGVYLSRSLSPAADPVVHLHGGPGGGVMDNVALTTLLFEDLRARRHIIAFDQRGVDASGAPTRCFETLGDYAEPITELVNGADIPALSEDRYLAPELEQAKVLIADGCVLDAVKLPMPELF